eukprot:Hpha_TRINITY_DN28262_c0_g1::TRINITY_DN28262_c0_g1_i1::g.116770::m.116770
MSKAKPNLPSGNFGRMGGAQDSYRFATDPLGYVEGKTAKHGRNFKATIAGKSSFFAAASDTAERVLSEGGLFPPSKSLLRMIRNAAGDVFLMEDDPSEAVFWAGCLRDLLYDKEGSDSIRGEHKEMLIRIVDE